MSIVDIFNTLSTTASANERKEIIKQVLESDKKELLVQIFEDCFGPNKYNIKSDRIDSETNLFSSPAELTIDNNYTTFHDLLIKLTNRVVTGNTALELTSDILSLYRAEDQKYLRMILDKRLKVGFSLEQINKLLDKKKKDFEVSLAYNLDDVKGVNPIDGTYYASRKLDGCVSGDTLITMANGSRLPIKYLVENEIHDKILSYNPNTGKVEKDEIVSFLKNGVDINEKENKHQWYEIELEDGRKIKLTGNHRVYLPKINCYRRVDELKGDETFLLID